MANEDKKDFNAKMNNSKDMPKIVELDSEASKNGEERQWLLLHQLIMID